MKNVGNPGMRQKFELKINNKLDGVGPVDNRPSTE